MSEFDFWWLVVESIPAYGILEEFRKISAAPYYPQDFKRLICPLQ